MLLGSSYSLLKIPDFKKKKKKYIYIYIYIYNPIFLGSLSLINASCLFSALPHVWALLQHVVLTPGKGGEGDRDRE